MSALDMYLRSCQPSFIFVFDLSTSDQSEERYHSVSNFSSVSRAEHGILARFTYNAGVLLSRRQFLEKQDQRNDLTKGAMDMAFGVQKLHS